MDKNKIISICLIAEIILFLFIGYKYYTYKPDQIDLIIDNQNLETNNTISEFIYNVNIDNTLNFNCIEYYEHQKLLDNYAFNAVNAFKTNKKCGWIYNEVLNDLENQDIKVYAVVIEDPDVAHIIPVIKLSNDVYYGYDHQFNAIYTTIVRGKVTYNIYSDIEGYYLDNGSWQITKWNIVKKDAEVYIKLIEISELYNYRDENWIFINLVDQYALKYNSNLSLCDLYKGGN